MKKNKAKNKGINHEIIADNCIAKLDFRKIIHVIQKSELKYEERIMDLTEIVKAARELILETLISNEESVRKVSKGFVAIKDKDYIWLEFIIDACREPLSRRDD